MGISADTVLVFAVPPCTPGTGVCPDRRRARRGGGGDVVCLPGEMLAQHGCSRPVGRGIGDDASDEAFRGSK